MPVNRADSMQIEIRIGGHLDQYWSTWFGGLTLAHEADGTTTLRGHVTDQAQLHGVLGQIRDLGAPLISLAPLPADSQHQRRPR
jgi:hypothetical protein